MTCLKAGFHCIKVPGRNLGSSPGIDYVGQFLHQLLVFVTPAAVKAGRQYGDNPMALTGKPPQSMIKVINALSMFGITGILQSSADLPRRTRRPVFWPGGRQVKSTAKSKGSRLWLSDSFGESL